MSQKKLVHLLVFNGFADWEPAYAIAEINKSSEYQLVTVAFQQTPIVSMGGLRILPDIMINQVNYLESELFILPGGYMWEQDSVDEIVPVVENCRNNNIPVAAICGATLFLANHGYLNNTPHTSNQIKYLKNFSLNYHGELYYQDKPCVAGNDFITANGFASLEFAREILNRLKIYDKNYLEQWYKVFKHGVHHWIVPEK